MNKSIVSLVSISILASVYLSACDSKPIVVVPPAEPTPVIVAAPPAPAALPGEPGPAGATGQTGATGEQGKSGEPSTIIVLPPTQNAAPASSSASKPELL